MQSYVKIDIIDSSVLEKVRMWPEKNSSIGHYKF